MLTCTQERFSFISVQALGSGACLLHYHNELFCSRFSYILPLHDLSALQSLVTHC